MMLTYENWAYYVVTIEIVYDGQKYSFRVDFLEKKMRNNIYLY